MRTRDSRALSYTILNLVFRRKFSNFLTLTHLTGITTREPDQCMLMYARMDKIVVDLQDKSIFFNLRFCETMKLL